MSNLDIPKASKPKRGEHPIAGNLKDMFRCIKAVGNDVDTRGNIRSGSILIENMTVAGS